MNSEDLQVSVWDTAEFLDSDELIIEYLKNAMEEGNDAFLSALSTVARAKGMTELAQKSGLARESLYKALKPGAKPRMETIYKVLAGLNIKLEPVIVQV